MNTRPLHHRPHHWMLTLAVLVCTGLAAAAALAQPKGPAPTAPTTPAARPAVPVDVTVGVYVVQMGDPDLKNSQFDAVFWLWFRWKGDKALDPMKKFEVVGGEILGRECEDATDDGDTHYQVAKLRAKVTQDFDIARFPIDQHTIELSIEETSDGIEAIRYVADARNSKLQESISLAGWTLGRTSAATGEKTYASTFGDPKQPDDGSSTYARFTLKVPVDRPGMGYPIKLFWSLYLSVFVALLAFQIKPIDLDPRFGLGVGAVFAAMASAYVISSALPDGNQVTIADRVIMVAIGFIVLSIIESIVSLRMHQAGKEHASTKLDRWSFVVFMAAYAAVNAWMLRP